MSQNFFAVKQFVWREIAKLSEDSQKTAELKTGNIIGKQKKIKVNFSELDDIISPHLSLVEKLPVQTTQHQQPNVSIHVSNSLLRSKDKEPPTAREGGMNTKYQREAMIRG